MIFAEFWLEGLPQLTRSLSKRTKNWMDEKVAVPILVYLMRDLDRTGSANVRTIESESNRALS